MSEPAPFFSETNNGTIFLSVQVWQDDDTGLLNFCTGAWEWEQVAAVIGRVTPDPFEKLEGPQCSLLWMGQHLHVRAEHSEVLRAWQRYKSRFGGQYIRLLAN